MAILSSCAESAKPTGKPNPSAELASRINASLDDLAGAIDRERASETFKRFLDVQSRFHDYSWRNTLLIYLQRPEASRVAGYRAWQKLGRQVRKGERGIRILAPCPFKRETSDGEVESGMFFRAVSVFDVSQTDGEDLPEVDCPTIDASADSLLATLTRVGESKSITVRFQPVSGGAFGVSHGGKVDIDNTYSTGQQSKTLAHELAHELLHRDADNHKALINLPRSVAELEAESIAYVVCRHFGLDCEVRSSRYIALWGGDSKALKASLQRISTTARTIIDAADALEVEGTVRNVA